MRRIIELRGRFAADYVGADNKRLTRCSLEQPHHVGQPILIEARKMRHSLEPRQKLPNGC
jgi:hypothetical protein